MAVAAAVVVAATALYGAYQSNVAQRQAGNYSAPTAPPPGNYTTYGQNGQITGETTWNASTNTYEYHTYNDAGKEPTAPVKPVAPVKPDQKSFMKQSTPKNGTQQGGNAPYLDTAAYDKALSDWQKATDDYNNVALPKYDADTAAYTKDHEEWVTKSASIKAENDKTSKLLSDAQSDLGVSYEDRLKRYDDAYSSFVTQQHETLDPQFEKEKKLVAERMNATGQTGSRADVDLNSELGKAKLSADREIAQNATMYKYALGDADFNRSLSTLTALKSGANADEAIALQKQGMGIQSAVMGGQANIASAAANQNSAYQQWLTKYAASKGNADTAMNTASGLAYLYGYGSKNNWWSKPAAVSSSKGTNIGYEGSMGDYANA